MEFTFEADPTLDIALGMEHSEVVEVLEPEEESRVWDLSSYDPLEATIAKPGSEDKVKMLSARYAAGLPLWDPKDRYDHGPDQVEEVEEVDDSEFRLPEEEEAKKR